MSTLPEDTSIATLVRLGKIRWRIEHAYRELKHELGWYHHTVLVTTAHLFVTTRRLTVGPKVLPAG